MLPFLQSWLLVPALLGVLALGAGLLLWRPGTRAVPGALLVPVGFAAVTVLCTLLTYLPETAPFAGLAAVVLALAGFIVARRSLHHLRPRRAWLWPAVAGLLPAGAIALPVLLTGQPGFTGYGRIVDLSHQFDLASWLVSEGRSTPAVIDTSSTEIVNKVLGVGYPAGAQVVSGVVAGLGGLDIAWAYQPFMAVLAAMLGLSLYSLLGSVIERGPLRALAAGVAAQPTILYSYAMAAGIKELAAAAMLVLVAALLAHHRPSAGSVREVLPAAVALAAAFAVFSLGLLPWLGVLLAVLVLADLIGRHQRARAAGRWAILGLTAALLSVPTIAAAFRLAPVAASGGPVDLGNLAAPVPAWAAAGVWLTGDHRYPLEAAGRETLTYVLIGVVLAFAVLGLIVALRRRALGFAALAAAALVALPYALSRTGPWVELKAISVTAPIVLAVAFAGAAALGGGRLRALGPLAVVAIAIAVLGGNALVYRSMPLADYDRLSELEAIGERYADQGPTYHPSFEEFAEYFLADAGGIGSVNVPSGRAPALTEDALPGLQFARDIDTFEPEYLNTYNLLVLRRDPTGSRPPSNWTLAERTEHYEVWRRDASPKVIEHVALTGTPGERTQQVCTDLRETLREAGPSARVAYAPAADVIQLTATPADVSSNWLVTAAPDFFATGPGVIRLTLEIPVAQEYEVWLRGSFGREVRVLIDGQEVGSVRWASSYPGHYEPIAAIELAAGEYQVEIRRGEGSLLPGTGNEIGGGLLTAVGPIAFAPPPQDVVRTAPASEMMDLCLSEKRFDWVEIVRPTGQAASDASLSAVPPPRPPA
jgi:hypothetical protein